MFWYVILSIWKTSRIFLAEIYRCIGFSIGVSGVGVGVGVGVDVDISIGIAFASRKALISYKFFYNIYYLKRSKEQFITKITNNICCIIASIVWKKLYIKFKE